MPENSTGTSASKATWYGIHKIITTPSVKTSISPSSVCGLTEDNPDSFVEIACECGREGLIVHLRADVLVRFHCHGNRHLCSLI